MRIVGAGRSLGMILHGEGRYAAMSHTLQGLIVQIHVCQFNLACIQRIRIYCKTMVLGCDFNPVRKEVLDRLIPSPMAEFELERLSAKGQTH